MGIEITANSRTISSGSADRLATRTWFAFSVVLSLNSVLRGIRAPGIWAYTEMLLNYDFGFSKRGLIGAIISLLHSPALYHYATYFWFSTAVLSVNLLLLLDLLHRLIATNSAAARLASLVFASSLAVVVLAHTIGYGDQIGLLVTLLALRIKNYYRRAIFCSVLVPISILIHETNFVIFFPVILFRLLVDLRKPPDQTQITALSAVAIFAVGTVLILGYTHITQVAVAEMYKVLQAKADYPLLKYDGITTTFAENMRDSALVWTRSDVRHFFFSCCIVTMPTTVYLVCGFIHRTDGSALLRLAGTAACLAPLSLHAIGSDFNRWTTLATTTSFLVLSIVHLAPQPTCKTSPSTPANRFAIPLSLIGLNLGSSIPLFDGYIVQSFPYEEHIHDVINMVTGKVSFPPPPPQCAQSGCITVINGLSSRSATTAEELVTSQ